MIQLLTALKINDNSGATAAKVIRVYNNRKYGVGGDLSLVSIIKNIPHSKVRKGDMSKGVLIRSNKRSYVISHHQTWKDNNLVLITIKVNDYYPVGTRIKGPVTSKLKSNRGCQKIVSISKRKL